MIRSFTTKFTSNLLTSMAFPLSGNKWAMPFVEISVSQQLNKTILEIELTNNIFH